MKAGTGQRPSTPSRLLKRKTLQEKPRKVPTSDPVAAAYDDLRAMAARYLAAEEINHTLQPTALVHEVWMRLRDQVRFDETGTRTRFVAGAATTMRRVLVDHARRRRSVKRGGGWSRVTLCDKPATSSEAEAVETIALDEAIHELAKSDESLARLAELRLFGGLSVAQASTILEWPLSTTKKRWSYTVAVLSRALRTGE